MCHISASVWITGKCQKEKFCSYTKVIGSFVTSFRECFLFSHEHNINLSMSFCVICSIQIRKNDVSSTTLTQQVMNIFKFVELL